MSELPIEIDVATIQQMRTEEKDFVLLDVRESDERDFAKIEDTEFLPMSQLKDRLDELEPHREKLIVVHCHHGGRSLHVTNFLRQNGFPKVQNMAGGIDDWSLSIDSSVPRY